jgi:hypothetical protein
VNGSKHYPEFIQLRLLFSCYLIRTPAGTPTVLTRGLRGFMKSLQENGTSNYVMVAFFRILPGSVSTNYSSGRRCGNIQGDSKLLARFPRPINGSPDRNLDSLCSLSHIPSPNGFDEMFIKLYFHRTLGLSRTLQIFNQVKGKAIPVTGSESP